MQSITYVDEFELIRLRQENMKLKKNLKMTQDLLAATRKSLKTITYKAISKYKF